MKYEGTQCTHFLAKYQLKFHKHSGKKLLGIRNIRGLQCCVAHRSAAGSDFVNDPVAHMYSLKLCICWIVILG
jgi:hypothetical protein